MEKKQILITLPIDPSLYHYLSEVRDAYFGTILVSIALKGFIKLMLVKGFSIKQHFNKVDALEELYRYEIDEIKMDMSLAVGRMYLKYRSYFQYKKYESIKVKQFGYTEYSLRFVVEVDNETF